MLKDAGILGRRDATLFSRWWTARGHIVVMDQLRRNHFRVCLSLKENGDGRRGSTGKAQCCEAQT
jgi:hypothetical protein